MRQISDFLECLDVDDNKFKIHCIKADNSITPYMKKNNQLWEDWLEKYIKEAYVSNTHIVDIGAHIGTFSLMASKYISKNCHIYSFEPVYGEILNKNVEENNLTDKIKIFPIGLSNKKETLEGGFVDFSLSVNYGFTRIDNLSQANDNSKQIIHIDTLDNLCLDNISFLKIDVEGNERNVLEGAFYTIKKNIPTILIEIWCTSENSIKSFADNKLDIKNSHKCFEFLFNLGYICIPVSASSDDFLFIHYKKRHILDKIINIL
jgi:FkbM family methyltransferase